MQRQRHLRKQNQTQRKQGYDGFRLHAFTFCKVQMFTVQGSKRFRGFGLRVAGWTSDQSEIRNPKYQTNYNDQNSKFQTFQWPRIIIPASPCFGHWILGFEICLLFGACHLEFLCRFVTFLPKKTPKTIIYLIIRNLCVCCSFFQRASIIIATVSSSCCNTSWPPTGRISAIPDFPTAGQNYS